MHHLPDGDYQWIFHVVDHWSKVHFAYPLVNKTAVEVVAFALTRFIFPMMGLPSILQSYNSREFVNQIIDKVLSIGRIKCN